MQRMLCGRSIILSQRPPKRSKRNTDPTHWKQEIAQFSDTISFDGLEIVNAEASTVTFTARLSLNGTDKSFT